MALPRPHLLPWDRPLLPQAVDWLAGDWNGRGALDLGHVLVVVPTRQSGRRLREALAARAAAQGQGVFPPRVLVPESLISDGAAAPDVASHADALLAWIEVLRTLDLTAFNEVFPIAPPARNFAWASRLARQFLRLQATLAENGLRLADPSDTHRFGYFPETTRWRQLARLEALYDAALARRERRDPQAARIAFARSPRPPAGVQRIVLLAVPDPAPLVVQALEKLADTIPVDVVIFGPAHARLGNAPRRATRAAPATAPVEEFDFWGRPAVFAWQRREPPLRDFEDHVHVCPDPAAQAARLAATAALYPEPARVLALGIADRETLAPLHNALQRAGIAAYDPEGRPRRNEPLFQILHLAAQLAREPLFGTVTALLRCPDILEWLLRTTRGFESSAQLLAELDRLHNDHLPANLESAQRHVSPASATGQVLAACADLRDDLSRHPFPENARRALARIFSGRTFDLARPEDDRAVATAAAWNETAARLADAAVRFTGTAPVDLLELALEEFGEGVQFDEKSAGALELLGWLELLWEDAPHLLVAGLNDGRVPEAIVGDAFLPEALREKLGLKTNAARLARDAYVLSALAAARHERGRLDLLVGRTNTSGDPLRPSRLLLACADEQLPARVQFLFHPISRGQADTPWRRAFQLQPPTGRPITHLSVTSFRGYLRCPFRFYLQHALRLRTVDPLKAELDDLDFGRLCHSALEELGRDPTLRHCADESRLSSLLLEKFDHLTREKYGLDVPVPLRVQLESAWQRLARAARVQAAERAAGWVIERIEHPFTLPIGGLTVRGTIDRIERNEQTGAIRVIDYKTKDSAQSPRESHVKTLGRNETRESVPEFACFDIDGKTYVWTDLQLPLYLQALRAEFGADVTCGYFLLPRAVSETAVVPWEDYSPAWHEAACRCAEGIVAAVQAGRFWPPAEIKPDFDDFASLFHQGAAESVAWPNLGTQS